MQRGPSRPKKSFSWAWLGWLLLFGLMGGVVGGGYEKRIELVAFYPPLASNVHVRPAGVSEHVFRGTGLRETWSDPERRGAYVGTFDIR